MLQGDARDCGPSTWRASESMSERSIDAFCHCLPPEFCQAVERSATRVPLMFPRAQQIKAMVDVETRLALMDRFPGYQQILSLASPTIEAMAEPNVSPDLARIGNDAMAELVRRHPTRFRGFIASLPMNNSAAAQAEVLRVRRDLKACGVQLYTNVNGAPLDRPEHLEVLELLGELECPVWLHPIRPMTVADYPDEEVSRFDIWWSLGWPYETTTAMVRLAFSGLFDRWPDLVIVTHHAGGVVSLMEGRLGSGMELLGTRQPPEHADAVATDLQEPLLDALRRFYGDTATFGARAAIECGKAFFGVDHLLFGSDMPFDPEEGPGYIRATLAAIHSMDLTPQERRQILSGNAERLFDLVEEA